MADLTRNGNGQIDASAMSERMHPLIAVLRGSLNPEDRQMLDELYEAAESNIDLALKTVGLVTDLEIILFALLIEQQKAIYLLREQIET